MYPEHRLCDDEMHEFEPVDCAMLECTNGNGGYDEKNKKKSKQT